MRTALLIATLLFATPALADTPALPPPTPDTKIEAPPSPPPIIWEVWGYRWNGAQYVKQPDHCLKTTDLKQAVAYAYQVGSSTGWWELSNVPHLSMPEYHFYDPHVPYWAPEPTEAPAEPVYSVWAFKLTNGKWVKDETYCWTAGRNYVARLDALQYAKNVNAVSGWCATTNAPDCSIPTGGQYIDGGIAHGAEGCIHYHHHHHHHH